MHVKVASRANSFRELRFAEIEVEVAVRAVDVAVPPVKPETRSGAVVEIERILGWAPTFGCVARRTTDFDRQITMGVNEILLRGCWPRRGHQRHQRDSGNGNPHRLPPWQSRHSVPSVR